jgi:drug/metabolite transporter (DMT)-like permease
LKSSKNRQLAFAALGGGVFFTGVSAVLIKSADAPGVVTAFYRMAIGSVALIIPFIVSIVNKKTALPIKGIGYAMLGGLFFGLDMSLWATGIVATNATTPTLAANLAPIWAALGAIWLFKEHPKRGFWIGLALSFLGIFIMVGRDLSSANGMLKGILYGLGAGMFYGLYYLVAQKGRALITTIHFLSISTFSSAFTLGVIMFFSPYQFGGYSQQTWIIFLIYGIGVQVIGWWMINFAQGYLRATVVAPTLLGQPVVTALVAFWVLNETHTLPTFIGGMVVLLGIGMVHWVRVQR